MYSNCREKNSTHPQANMHRNARNWPSLGTRKGVESEPVTAVCIVRMYQKQPSIQVINASSRASLASHIFLKEIESMFMSFCSQQLTFTPKKETKRKSFCNHRLLNHASASTKRSRTSRNVYQRKQCIF